MRRFLIGLCAVATVSCARTPPPPYPLAFTIGVSSPRVLQATEEIAVPIQVVNTGQRAWDPARVHVSYHWLWLVPRETAARSRWNVPYHDGIRSELTAAVPPGGHSALQGRVLAPSVPGLYWLQWDMVEEGVVWFAQVSPRQPRSLVLVVPPIAWVFAPLPLVAAIVGLVLVRLKPDATEIVRLKPDTTEAAVESGFSRTVPVVSGFSRTSDIVWCATCLFAKPFVVYRDALLEPTAVAYWLTLIAAAGPVIVIALVFPRRIRVWLLLAAGVFGSLVVLADVVYYRFFGDVLSAPALLGLGQTGQVWGSIRSLFTPGLVWLLVDIPFAFWLALKLSRLPAPSMPFQRRAIVAIALSSAVAVTSVLLAVPRAIASGSLAQVFRDRAIVEQLGAFGFHAYDGWNYVRATWMRPLVTDAQVEDATAWFAERRALRAGVGPMFGVARGKNVIVVQVESLQEFAVDYRVDDQDVMPHLRQWSADPSTLREPQGRPEQGRGATSSGSFRAESRGDSLRFTNVTDQTSEGRTSDAELTAMASLLPLDHGAAAFRYPGNHYVGLPRVLAEHGYQTLSAVAFEPGFWNRRVMHPAYGFQRMLFEPDFRMTEQIGWGLNDRDFLQQMIPQLTAMRRPFLAWTITLSLHHPFSDFPASHKVLKLGALEGTSLGNYLHTMRFFDGALEGFKAALAANGLLDDSLLVVFGDHDAGFVRDAADDVQWTMNDRVPIFIRGAGLRGVRTMPAGQTDLAPTLLALVGIDSAPLPYVGRNLLGAPFDGARDKSDATPVLRPYGDWVDDRHLYLTRGADHACIDLSRRLAVDRSACGPADEAARRERDVSRRVLVDDLQQRIRERLAAWRAEARDGLR